MIEVSSAALEKINNPLQLPSNEGDPRLILWVMNGHGGTLYTQYADLIQSGTITSSYEEYSYNMSLTLLKGNLDLVTNTLFVPGSKIALLVGFGTTTVGSDYTLPLFTGHIDEIDPRPDEDTFTITATNNIPHLLKSTYMGETIQLTGLSHEVGATIMDLAEVPSYYITIGTYEWTYTYKPNDTCLSALEQMYPIFPKDGYGQPGFGILEKPSGGVVFGYWRDRTDDSYGLPVGNYIFDCNDEAFSMSTRMNSDKCYSKIYATGKAADGVDLEKVIINVSNFNSWYIPTNKIYFADFNGYTHQELLEDWAETIALELRNQGITDEISGPFRPHITVGDIASMTIGNVGRQGVITSITHHVGLEGFSTDFSIDSGGVYSAITGWSSQMKANGYNRRQNLVDLVREIAEETTEEALNLHDPISIQDMWDEEEEEEKELIPQRNEMLIEYDGRNWQDLVQSDDEEEEE